MNKKNVIKSELMADQNMLEIAKSNMVRLGENLIACADHLSTNDGKLLDEFEREMLTIATAEAIKGIAEDIAECLRRGQEIDYKWAGDLYSSVEMAIALTK